METRAEQIERLKHNWKPLVALSDSDIEIIKELANKTKVVRYNCLLKEWEYINCRIDDYDQYRIHESYTEHDSGYDEVLIENIDGILQFKTPNDGMYSLGSALSCSKVAGFKFSDGVVRNSPIVYTDGKYNTQHYLPQEEDEMKPIKATHVLFEKQ